MTDKKPTDAEIIKALECCVSEQYTCRDCPYQEIKHYSDDEGFQIMPNGKKYDDWSCERWLNVDLLALINRLQADVDNYKQIAENQQKIILDKAFENKRLRTSNDALRMANELCKGWEERAKAEAYKEFAERLKERKYLDDGWSHGEHPYVVEESDIDEVLEELVGEDNG